MCLDEKSKVSQQGSSEAATNIYASRRFRFFCFVQAQFLFVPLRLAFATVGLKPGGQDSGDSTTTLISHKFSHVGCGFGRKTSLEDKDQLSVLAGFTVEKQNHRRRIWVNSLEDGQSAFE